MSAPQSKPESENNSNHRPPSPFEVDSEPTTIPPTAPNPRDQVSPLKWRLSLTAILFAAFLYGLDVTITASIQASAYKSLGEIQKIQWVGLGFTLASSSTMPFFGRLYTLFDMKWLTCGFVLIFEVGSAVCGSAHSMNSFIVGRVVAGLGGSGMYVGAMTIVNVFSTPKQLPLNNALVGMTWAVGAILGPVVGGSLSDSDATWRWAFYINLPLMALFAPIFLFVLPSFTRQPDLALTEKVRQLDFLGAFLHLGTFVLFLTATAFSGSLYGWSSAFTISLYIIWGVFLVAYILQQALSFLTLPSNRVFPAQLLKSRTMILLYICTSAAGSAFFTALYYIPIYFQFTRGDSALHSATRLLPLICIYVFASALCGALLPRIKLYAGIYTFAGALIIIGGALMSRVNISTPLSQIYGYEVLIAFGGGLSFQAGYAIASAKADPALRPLTVTFINIAQIGGIAISLAMAGCIFQNVGFRSLKAELSDDGIPDTVLRLALGGREAGVLETLPRDVVEKVVAVVARTIAKVFNMVLAAGAVMFVAALGMRWERLEFARPGDKK